MQSGQGFVPRHSAKESQKSQCEARMTPAKRKFILSLPDEAAKLNSGRLVTSIDPEALQAACPGH